MRTAYVAEVLKDGHLSFPNDVKKKLHLHEGMKIKVMLEDIVKYLAKVEHYIAESYKTGSVILCCCHRG